MVAGLVSLIFAVLFGYMFYENYLLINFNGEGRYYDARGGIVITDSSFVYGILALFCILLSIAFFIGYRFIIKYFAKRLRRMKEQGGGTLEMKSDS